MKIRPKPLLRRAALVMSVASLLMLCNAFLQARPSADYGRIELWRDRWGTPHVFSTTDAGAMYGLGYATAEDRLYQMSLHRRIMQGRLAEALGDLAKRQPRSAGPNSALEEDRLMRTLGYARHAKRVAARLDADTRRLLQAYCEGVNDYLAEHSQSLHPLFAQQGWRPEPWTPADCLLAWWHLAKFFSADGLRELWAWHQSLDPAAAARRARAGHQVIDDEAAVVRREDVSEAWIEETHAFMRRYGLQVSPAPGQSESGPKFSHAWVIGGTRTTTGAAVLVSDPQTPVWNPSMLYEFHIAGRTFNARGVGVAGSPLIMIGFTHHVAWGLTALGADQADLFRLQTSPAHPGSYRLDGQWKRFDVRTETIQVRDQHPVTLEVRETVFGPVVSEFALGRRSGEEVALKRVPLCDADRDTIQGGFAMIRARTAAEFGQALSGWRFPTANCVFGDAQGAIGYWTIGAIPVRAPRSPGPPVAQDGSSLSHDWQTFIPHELLPHVLNPKRGYLVSANHRTIQSFYQLTLGTSTGAAGDTDRGWRIKQRITAFLANHDKFRPEDVLDIQSDCVNAVKRAVLQIAYHLRDLQHATLSDAARRALDYLEPWYRQGAASDMSRVGTELANAMNLPFRSVAVRLAETYGGGVSGQVLAMKTITARLARDPRAKLEPEVVEYVDTLLSTAWRQCLRAYGPDPAQWHERALEAAQRSTLGYQESLTGYPSLAPEWDVARPLLRTYDTATILAQPGQSYTQFVPLHDADASLSILPPGSSEHPASPFRFSALGDWASGRLRPAPLSRKAVEPLVIYRRDLSRAAPPQRTSAPARRPLQPARP